MGAYRGELGGRVVAKPRPRPAPVGAWLLTANLGMSHASAPKHPLQLPLGDRLLPKYAFEEPLQGFYPGRQLLHLCGDGLQLQVAHASLYRSSTVKPSGTPYYREPEIGSTGLGSGVALSSTV
jgi:hypothetical protein